MYYIIIYCFIHVYNSFVQSLSNSLVALLLCVKFRINRIVHYDLITSIGFPFIARKKSGHFLICSAFLPYLMALEGLACLESLPRDEDDIRFVKSFDCVDNISTAGAVEFFNKYGFVVLRSVFDSSECERTREAMWSILESGNPEFKHDDQTTWGTMKSKGNYGLSTRGPSFHPVLVNNRQVVLMHMIIRRYFILCCVSGFLTDKMRS